MNFNKPPPHPSPPSPSPALHTPLRAVRWRQVSCQHNPLCLRQHKRGPQPLTEKFKRWPENTRARARDRVTFRAEPPGHPGQTPGHRRTSQLSPRGSALSILARHLRASLPAAPHPEPGRTPSAARGLQETLPRGARRLPQPLGSGSLSPATKAAVTGLWPWGANRTGWVSSPPEKVSRAPARAGRVCTARQRAAPAGQRRALTPVGPPLITPAPAPRRLPAPRVPAAAHLALAAREDRGWPSPGSGLVSPPPAGWRRRAPLARPSSSEELAPPLAGVCVCRASRPRAQVPGAERGGGRRGRRRIPQVRPLPLSPDLGGGGDPRPPPSAPPLDRPPFQAPPSLTLAEGSGDWARGPPPRVYALAPGARASIPKLVWLPGGGRVWPLRGRVCPLRGARGLLGRRTVPHKRPRGG
ncbi:basic salivary proline-rich protein 1-like [Odocoileus virginianus]|uniref:Basic salivary proline-rich protein 1-like n=1 Tax=Odocoileus virginianus TaxID=9874 RepID=A0ABM4H0N1_ODOVR